MFTLTNTQKVTLTATPLDSKGNVADVTGLPVAWVSSDPSVGTLTPSADGKTCDFITNDVSGNTTVTATFGNISGSLDITVTLAPVVIVEITAGTPVEK